MSDSEIKLSRIRGLIARYYSPVELARGLIGTSPTDVILQPYGDVYGLSVGELIQYMIRLLSPKIPIYSTYIPDGIFKNVLFGTSSEYIRADTEITSDKRWFVYINGLATNKRICESNVMCIERELNRVGCVNAIANETDSIYTDVLKGIPFYSGSGLTDATVLITSLIFEKLLDPEVDRCVVIAHSHGCQVMGLLLAIVHNFNISDDLKRKYMGKLEVYNFATPTLEYNYVVDELPYIEHIANEYDVVANLSGIGLDDSPKTTHDGTKLIRKGVYGHFFNTYYMEDFKNRFPESKLNDHIIQCYIPPLTTHS